MAEISSQWFYRLKAAQRDLIERCGTIERAAQVASLSKSQMGRFNNAGDPELMPLSAVLMLEADCGMPVVTAVMAELNGRRLADEEIGEVANACIMTAHADVVVQAGELMAKGAMAFADGKLSPAEAAGLDRQAAALERSVSEMRRITAGPLAHLLRPARLCREGLCRLRLAEALGARLLLAARCPWPDRRGVSREEH